MSAITMFVINPMTADTRVEKEAASLAAAGHDVTVVATAADGLPLEEERDGYRIVRVPYQRVVKQRVVGPAERLAAARRSREQQVAAADAAGLRVPGPVSRVGWLVRRLLVRLWVLAGGAMLKTVRTRILVPEYRGSIAAASLERLGRPDVLHAHDLGPLSTTVRLARRWGGSGPTPLVVYDSHELYVEQQTTWSRREKLAWKLHERRWIRGADGVITVSGGIARELRRRYRLADEPTLVLNSPPPERVPATSDVRTDVGLGADVPLCVYVGTVKPGRGVDRLVAALPHGDWHLAIVGGGSGPEVQAQVARAAELGVGDRLHVLPGVPAATLPTYLATADVGAHAMENTCRNHDLALPNKLFDYLFAGLPVAVSDLTEMRQLVTEHGVGTVFDPDDPTDVSRSIARAARGEDVVPASAALLEELSWARQEQRLLALYERLGVRHG